MAGLSAARRAELAPPEHPPDAVAKAIQDAFARSTAQGALHLATEVRGRLHPTVEFWRELGKSWLTALAVSLDPLDPYPLVLPPGRGLDALLAGAPPMRGGERLTLDLLSVVWRDLGALAEAQVDRAGGAGEWLHATAPAWHGVGRVCLHVAENKDHDRPFAFLATYVRAGPAGPQHVPLGKALVEFADQRDQLLRLLEPLQRAAEGSELVRRLVDSGGAYHPLAWTADEAYALLKETPALEAAGLTLRFPDFWRRRSRPSVRVSVGDAEPSVLGLDALLQFDRRVSLGDQELSAAEVTALLAGNAGLMLLKGQWVEVDPEQLQKILDWWDGVPGEGVTLSEALRLLASGPVEDEDGPPWSEVVAGRWLEAQLESLRSPAVGAAIEANAGLQAELRPYQKVGVQWLWSLYCLGMGGCLADDMGLGKTIQVIGLMSLLQDEGSDLLIVPASLVDNWRREIERFAPAMRVLIAHSSRRPVKELKALTEKELDGADVVVTTYGTAARLPWVSERRWRCLVLDEAQAIKNPGARQTKAVKKLTARWRLALTGTPVENRLGDLWSLFDFLSPGLLGTRAQFAARSRAMAKARSYGPLRRLVAPWILRRLKTDRRVISDLPDKTEMTARCLLRKPQAALYEQAVAELAESLRTAEGMARRGLVLAALLRFKQICNHPSQWLGDGAWDPKASGKFDRLSELCGPIVERQEKVLVFTQFRSMIPALVAHLEAVFGAPGLQLHGGTRVGQRQEIVERFQTDESVPFLVLSLKAGGTGLNLTAANHVVHFDRWWNPAVENQATDRAFRIGQRRSVVVHKFVCQGTVEERIDDLIRSKQTLADEVLGGGGEAALTEMSNDELLAMVRLDLNSAVGS